MSEINPDAVLQLEKVTVRRGEKYLLRDVDWTVELDERWAVLGPNGAGKTTLLQLAATLMFPTAGAAFILGEKLGAVDVFEVRPRVGFSSAALAGRIPPNELVSDVVVSAGYAVIGRWREAYGRPDMRRASRLLERFGVGELATRRYGTLSEGERKRVLIARALMADPEMLLLDEPAAGMDLGGREDLVARLSRMALDDDAPTTILVTHHVEEIPRGFTHALLLREGAVVAAGPVRDVLTSQHLTAAFGLPLTVRREAGRWYARAHGDPLAAG